MSAASQTATAMRSWDRLVADLGVPPASAMALRTGDWLKLSAARFPDRECFIDVGEGVTLTFDDTNRRVNQLANALTAGGLRKPDRIALLGTDSHRYMEALMASMKLGTVYVALNFRLAQFELQNLIAAAGAEWIFVSRRYLELARSFRTASGLPLQIVCFDGPDDGCVDYEQLLAEAPADEPVSDVEDEDIISLAFTSGTTGLPKGVLQSQRMMKQMVRTMMLDYGVMPDDRRYSAAPIFHISGMGMIYMGVARGFPNVIAPQFDARAVVDWFKEGRVTAAFLVPTMISQMLEVPGVGESEYDGLRSIVYGASPMTPTLLRRAMSTFKCDFVQAFGAGTEAGMQSVLSAADHRRALAGEDHLLSSVGKAAYGVELRIVDEELRDVERGQIGEIVTRSESVMSGYLGMPEQSAAAIRDGWFCAGDLARMDDDGYLYLAGRSKDMIIRGGENIYPIEIESVIAEHPSVLDVAVIGAPDEHWGEIVIAYITLRSATTAPTLEELQAHCRRKLAGYKQPAGLVVLDEFPKNATGKLLKRELRERHIASRT